PQSFQMFRLVMTMLRLCYGSPFKKTSVKPGSLRRYGSIPPNPPSSISTNAISSKFICPSPVRLCASPALQRQDDRRYATDLLRHSSPSAPCESRLSDRLLRSD